MSDSSSDDVSTMTAAQLRARILELSREYSRRTHAAQRPAGMPDRAAFVPGVTPIPYAGRVFAEDEVEAAVASVLDFWLTLGPEGEAFERELAAFLGVRRSVLTNSGSSANLVALSALTSPMLPSERRLRPGDEVITCAAGFPTTVAPIVQSGAVPVFVDADPVTGNLDPSCLEEAYRPGKTRAVMLAHALGNPFDLGRILAFCRRHDLWLVEDNCDALGSRYAMPPEMAAALGGSAKRVVEVDGLVSAYTGTWGDLSTQSFYPPHHLTMGEGGAINVAGPLALVRPVESFRDWGRDCWCASGMDNTCGKRFEWELGELPAGYDHKYIYAHLGYNLKPLDVQAAIGRVQLRRMPGFIEARQRHWMHLRSALADLDEYFEFSLPTHATRWTPDGFVWDASGCRTSCSWFGFLLLVRPGAPFTNSDLARHLESRRIGSRMLFGGNLLRQPAFVQLRRDRPDAVRVVGTMNGADRLMQSAVFLGTYPGLSAEMLAYEVEAIRDFVKQRAS